MPLTASDLRSAIERALAAFGTEPLPAAARAFFKTLGYSSDRTIPVGSIDAFCRQFDPEGRLAHPSALRDQWRSVHLVFQLTNEELSATTSLFQDTAIKPGLLQSYLFFAIELTGKDYARGKLTAIARQLNRIFPMPVMLLLRHGDSTGVPVLSIAVINRRQNKLHADRDVLEKVTLIRDIALTAPHRGHLDILASFAVPNLVHPQRLPINSFDALHAAWEQIFNIDLLNERFYRELANWYFWALPQVDFPADLEPDAEKRRATGLIRLLTRLIFCWFLKEKGLIPEKLFHPADLAQLLKGFDPDSETSSTYYQAILQNLFFATLNQRMGKNSDGKPYRVFAKDEGFPKNKATYDINNLYRYESLFREGPDAALAHFADIPFLNGGLFECLDRTEDGTDKKRYLDGFSRNAKKRPHVPDRLFFDSGETADLSTAYGDTKRRAEKVTGLIHILNRYKFTIVENTPIDQEIALDPELLGKVFENLLASYNEETKTTARKQTGSFYTPRPIVDYMVDESLKAHFTRKLNEARAETRRRGVGDENAHASETENLRASAPPRDTRLDQLFAYTESPHQFTAAEVATLITAIDEVKILDPACGSGAFPMGVLHKLVYILGKLDPDNERWKQTQLAKLDSAPMRDELERAFADNNDDYGRKLYLIENCLYGVDIQAIAIQITKLRFFISLVCDQKTNRSKKDNHGIRPLPNLETKFVAANTLIGLPEMDQMELVDPRVYRIEAEIETLYHSHFSIQRRDQKLAVQSKVKALRKEMAEILAGSLMTPAKSKHVAEWDPFDPQSSADFFDPHWMFGRPMANGVDIIIGNPPYRMLQPHNTGQAELDFFRGHYVAADFKIELFHLFLQRGTSLLSASGCLGYIVPTTLLNNVYAEKLRQWLMSRCAIKTIAISPMHVFAEADVHTSVVILTRETHAGSRAGNLVATTTELTPEFAASPGNYARTLQSRFTALQGCVWNVLLNETNAGLIEKIRRAGPPLEVVAKINRGLITGNRKQFFSEKKLTERHVSILTGADVKRYSTKEPNEFVLFERPESAGGCWDKDVHLAPHKVVVRQIGTKPTASFIAKPIAVTGNIFTIRGKSAEHERLILGILNSALIEFFWGIMFSDFKSTFPQVTIFSLAQVPVSDAPTGSKGFDSTQRTVIRLVDEILAVKRADAEADTRELERAVNTQVYALYGLTPEEIAIVEGSAK